jgi:cell wall-associated NlpC family hydrolase
MAMFKQAGLSKAILNSSSCQALEKWAVEKGNKIPLAKAKRGDVILFDFSDSGVAQHVGIALSAYNPEKKNIHTIEGNTGDKSQTNGDGVYLKTRGAKFIRCVIRPRFPLDKENGENHATI